MKTKEELKELKQEFESLTNKLSELTQEELKLVTGGVVNPNANLYFVAENLAIK